VIEQFLTSLKNIQKGKKFNQRSTAESSGKLAPFVLCKKAMNAATFYCDWYCHLVGDEALLLQNFDSTKYDHRRRKLV
jgi:hypothetical protein